MQNFYLKYRPTGKYLFHNLQPNEGFVRYDKFGFISSMFRAYSINEITEIRKVFKNEFVKFELIPAL